MESNENRKYIDSEKLIASIKRKIESIENCPFQLASFGEEKKSEGELIAYKDALSLIVSLQQEQPENICSRCVYRNKTDELCEYPYGGRRCRINENGIYECNGFEEIEQQGQPESELEEAARHVYESWMGGTMDDVRRDMVELGKALNARKEEQQ